MKLKTVISIGFIVAFLVSCAPGAGAPTSIAPASPTQTPLPRTTLIQSADLYSGPGNQSFSVLKNLAAGTEVTPLAQFGDFVEVKTAEALDGFVYGAFLQDLPASLPVLAVENVPWRVEDVRNSFLGDGGFIHQDQIKVVDINGTGTNIDGGGIPLDSATRLRMKLTLDPKTSEYASVELIGQPTPTGSNWWQGIIRLDVGVNARNTVQLCVRDGTSENCNLDTTLNIPADQPFTVQFDDPQGKTLRILDQQNQLVTKIDFASRSDIKLPEGFLPQKTLWLGAWVQAHTTLMIDSFAFERAPDGKWNPDSPQATLRALAKQKGILLGSEFWIWGAREYPYWTLLNNTDEMVAVSEFSWKGNWYGRGDYNFTLFDKIVDFAIEKGWTVYGSHLVFGVGRSDMPEWLANSHFTRQEYIDILKEHVQTLVKRYAGRVKIWSIANEAIQRSYAPGGDFWNDVIGPDYIGMCFQWAHEADPNALLIFNGDRNDSPRSAEARQNIEKTYQVVKALKEKGIPIDGVGMQMHFFSPWDVPILPKKEDVLATMQRFGELGVKVYVTEFSVNLNALSGTKAEKYKVEADIYRDMLSACLESGVCAGFEFWGLADQWTWEIDSLKIKNADPALFDQSYQPKPAYFAVYDVLNSGNQGTK